MVVVNTRDFHRPKPSSQPGGPRTPQRRNTIAMGDLRSPPLVREREVDAPEETRISSSRGAKPPPPMRTTSLKTVTAGAVADNELLASSNPAEIPLEGTMVQRWSSEQNPDPVVNNGPERLSAIMDSRDYQAILDPRDRQAAMQCWRVGTPQTT